MAGGYPVSRLSCLVMRPAAVGTVWVSTEGLWVAIAEAFRRLPDERALLRGPAMRRRPQSSSRFTSRGGELVEVLCWWAALLGCWMVTTTSVTWAELVAGAVLALPCAVCAHLARRAYGARWSPDPRWLTWLLALPAGVARDTALVARLLLPGRARERAGRLREV